jgi:hypothetical protein
MFPLAYIDPGSGAVLLQCAIALIATAGLFFRRYLLLPLLWIRGKKKSSDETPTGDEE